MIIQDYVAAGLRLRGHHLTLLAPDGLDDVAVVSAAGASERLPRSWSRAWWFRAAGGAAWHVQRRLGVPYLNVFSNRRALDAYLRGLPGHDVVHERHSLYRAGAAMASRRLGLPYVLFFEADEILEHDVMGTPLAGMLRRRARQIARHNLRVADRVTCVSEAARARLADVWRVDARKITVLPNAVDVDRFRPDLAEAREIRRSVSPGGPLVVFVGAFYAWHGIETLLRAFKCVLDEFPAARLMLVGDGAARDTMQATAEALGIAPSVTFTGRVPHDRVPAFMAAADIAAAPYESLGGPLWLSPLKVYEYMASGAAIVASRVGQIAEVITDGRNGLLVTPGDPRDLAAAMGRLMRDAAERAALGSQARDDATRRHSWGVYIDRLEQVFQDAVAARGGRRGGDAPHRFAA